MERSDGRELINWTRSMNCPRAMSSPAGSRRLRKRRKRPRVPGNEMESQIERLRAESVAYLDRLARLQAEFDNFRKRAAREQQEYREYALAEALKLLLPILDSLDRALKTEAGGGRGLSLGHRFDRPAVS